MVTSPNQKQIVIRKTNVEKGTGKSRAYFITYTDIVEAAARDLSNTAFKLYIYLLSNGNGFISAFSPKDVSDRYGCSMDSAREAFKILVDTGCLTLVPGTKSKYEFTDNKAAAATELPLEISAQLITKKFRAQGQEYDWTYDQLLKACGNDEETAKNLWEGAN